MRCLFIYSSNGWEEVYGQSWAKCLWLHIWTSRHCVWCWGLLAWGRAYLCVCDVEFFINCDAGRIVGYGGSLLFCSIFLGWWIAVVIAGGVGVRRWSVVSDFVNLIYFMVVISYCYCSRGRLTYQGTNLGKVTGCYILFILAWTYHQSSLSCLTYSLEIILQNVWRLVHHVGWYEKWWYAQCLVLVRHLGWFNKWW